MEKKSRKMVNWLRKGGKREESGRKKEKKV